MLKTELLARVIALIQKNGDKVVVADPATGKAVVVMDLDAYETLCAAHAETAPAVAPVRAPEIMPKPAVHVPEKIAEQSVKNDKKKPVKVTPETMGTTHLLADLTQEQLIDKINRDIGAWKTAQDLRRTDELKSAVQPAPQPQQPASALEDEERFYLEPIE